MTVSRKEREATILRYFHDADGEFVDFETVSDRDVAIVKELSSSGYINLRFLGIDGTISAAITSSGERYCEQVWKELSDEETDGGNVLESLNVETDRQKPASGWVDQIIGGVSAMAKYVLLPAAAVIIAAMVLYTMGLAQ